MDIYDLERYEKIVRRIHGVSDFWSGSGSPSEILRAFSIEKFIMERVLYYLKANVSLQELEEFAKKKNKKIEEGKKRIEVSSFKKRQIMEINKDSFLKLIQNFFKE